MEQWARFESDSVLYGVEIMLTIIRNDAGQIEACCEWWLRDDDGHWNPSGKYVWVNQLECATQTEARWYIRALIARIAHAAPWAVGAYWERRDKPEMPMRAFRRDQLVKEVQV